MPKVRCINNTRYPASLELGKVYERVLFPNYIGMVAVIDESGESYLYPDEMFEEVIDFDLILKKNASIKRLAKRLKKERNPRKASMISKEMREVSKELKEATDCLQ